MHNSNSSSQNLVFYEFALYIERFNLFTFKNTTLNCKVNIINLCKRSIEHIMFLAEHLEQCHDMFFNWMHII